MRVAVPTKNKLKMETLELTNTQEQFLIDLANFKCIIASMVELQEKYAHIASKASIKRDIDSLVSNHIITREHNKLFSNGKITSITIYKLK